MEREFVRVRRNEGTGRIVLIGLCAILFALVTYGIGFYEGLTKRPMAAFAMGYEESKGVWNRIRVDSEGRVLCSR